MSAPVRARAVDVCMPQLGETVTEGTVTRWLRKVGDAVAEGDPLFEVSTDKVDTEVPAAVTGRLVEILVPVDATVAVGARLAVVETVVDIVGGAPRDGVSAGAGVSGVALEPAAVPAAPHPVVAVSRPRHSASPRVRRLLREHGLDEASVRRSGPGGRVSCADVTAVVIRQELSPSTYSATAPSAPTVAEAGRPAGESGFVAMQVDFHAIDTIRSRVHETWAWREGNELGYLTFVAAAAVEAIRSYPHVNAGGDAGPSSHVVHLAVDSIIVSDANDLRLEALARAIEDTVQTTQPGTRPATFSLRNPGRYGTLLSRAVLSKSAPVILSLDAVRPAPYAVPTDGGYAIAIRPVGAISLTFDPTVVDETTAARFLGRVRELLETRDWSDELR